MATPIYFAWMKSMYFREYVCRFSRKLHYFCILGVSHLKEAHLYEKKFKIFFSSLGIKPLKYADRLKGTPRDQG